MADKTKDKQIIERLEKACSSLAITRDSPSEEYLTELLNGYRQSEIDELTKEVKTLTSLAIDYVNQINDFKKEVERLRKGLIKANDLLQKRCLDTDREFLELGLTELIYM